LDDNYQGNADLVAFIVGNKTDLASDGSVTKEQGAEKASEYGAEFAAVSAETRFGLGDRFASLPQAYLEHQTSRRVRAAIHLNPAPIRQIVERIRDRIAALFEMIHPF
jgi:hypothetical protein